MTRRRTIILATIAALMMLGIGVHYVGRHAFLDPVTDATTDVAQYATVLAQWRPTGMVNHFPTTIPPNAQAVDFSAFPGSGQGGSWIQLRCRLTPNDVAAVTAIAQNSAGKTYPGGGGEFDHLNQDARHEWPTASFHAGNGTSRQWDFPPTYTFYVIKAVDRGMGSWDPYDGCGIAISEATNEVVYWASR